MADFRLTEDQEKQIIRENIQQTFLFKLDCDPNSAIALTGIPKKDAAGMISCREVAEGLKALGVTTHRIGEFSGNMYEEMNKPIADQIAERNEDPNKGVRVIAERVLLKAIPKVLSADASDLEKTVHEGVLAIIVPAKEFRHFVEATGVDFAGKDVVLHDVAVRERARMEERSVTLKGEVQAERLEERAILDKSVMDFVKKHQEQDDMKRKGSTDEAHKLGNITPPSTPQPNTEKKIEPTR